MLKTNHAMRKNSKLRVAIDCRIADARQGVGSAVLALAKTFSDSKVADQEYTFLVQQDLQSWLAPYIYGPCKLVGIPGSRFSSIKKSLRWIKPLKTLRDALPSPVKPVPRSDGYVESNQFDVVHFPTQSAYLTDLPSIYQPWDLQHLHYPRFFTKAEYALRERYYRAFCEQASFVCVQAEWTKADIIKHHGIEAKKVLVIPWGSVFDSYRVPSPDTVQATVKKYNLPEQFFFYPAVTWPHKNHEVILRALHALKAAGHEGVPNVYFSGSSTDYRRVLNKLARELGISKYVHFLGFLTTEELQAVFGTATAMVFPSKFEGFGLPILEAFHAGLPVLCSNATTLPEVAQDAALYFDPDAPEQLAKAMRTILDKPELRQELIKKGTKVLSNRSMKDTVADFQALYERAAAAPISQDDRLMQVALRVGGEE